jgi:hypothetical protein
VERIGLACGVPEFSAVRGDWWEQYRAGLEAGGGFPLGVELRLLIAEVAPTVRRSAPGWE